MAVKVYTLNQLAQHTGLHRTTLIRMEQRGVIDKAAWSPALNGRVYDQKLFDKVNAQIGVYMNGKADNGVGRTILADVEVAGR